MASEAVLDALSAIPAQPAGVAVLPPDAVAPPPADTAPPATSLRWKVREGVRTDGLDAGLAASLNQLWDLTPEKLRTGEISSGTRTTEQQAAARGRMEAGTGGLAARPGMSLHEEVNGSKAVDFGSGSFLTWLHTPEGKSALDKSGLEAPFAAKGDPFHVQLKGAHARSSNDAVQQALDAVPVAGSPGSRTPGLTDSNLVQEAVAALMPRGSNAASEWLTTASAGSFLDGTRRGLMDVPLGAAQAILPRETMRPLEDAVTQLNSNFDNLRDEHPIASGSGRVLGNVLGIMGASRLLGPAIGPFTPAIVSRALTAIGPLGRNALVGGTTMGSQFYEKGNEGEKRFGLERLVPGGARSIDTMIGTVFGAATAPIVKSAEWLARNVSDSSIARSFLNVVKSNAEDVSRNSERAINDALAVYKNAEQVGAKKYQLRNSAGTQFEGFELGVGEEGTTGFKQAIEGALEASKKAGVNTRNTVESAANRVKDILGIKRAEGEWTSYQAAVEDFNKQFAPGTAVANALSNPAIRGNITAALEAQGIVLPRQPDKALASAAQYSEARTAINDALRRSRKDPAARTQLQMMLRGLDDEAASVAADYGMNAQSFIRKAAEANKFYEQNVAPLRKFFDGRKAGEVLGRDGVPFSGTTPAAFYDKVVNIIESGDTKAVRDLAQMFGPEGKDQLRRIVAAQAVSQLDDKGALQAVKYVQSNQDALREILPRDQFASLLGGAKISEEVFNRFMHNPQRATWSYGKSIGPALGFYELGHAAQAALTGGPIAKHIAGAAVMFGAVPAMNFARKAMNGISNIRWLEPIVRSAAHMTPGSPELKRLVDGVERRLRVGTIAVGRAEEVAQ